MALSWRAGNSAPASASDYFIRWSGQSRKGRQDWRVLADGDRTPPLFSDECLDDVIGDCLEFSRLVSGVECG
jgi:hypothetical protein